MAWQQKLITLKARPRGVHLVTTEIETALGDVLGRYTYLY